MSQGSSEEHREEVKGTKPEGEETKRATAHLAFTTARVGSISVISPIFFLSSHLPTYSSGFTPASHASTVQMRAFVDADSLTDTEVVALARSELAKLWWIGTPAAAGRRPNAADRGGVAAARFAPGPLPLRAGRSAAAAAPLAGIGLLGGAEMRGPASGGAATTGAAAATARRTAPRSAAAASSLSASPLCTGTTASSTCFERREAGAATASGPPEGGQGPDTAAPCGGAHMPGGKPVASRSGGGGKAKRGQRGRKATKKAHEKRRPLNSFMLWSKEARMKLAAEHPELHNSEISRRLGHLWRELPESERARYKQLSLERGAAEARAAVADRGAGDGRASEGNPPEAAAAAAEDESASRASSRSEAATPAAASGRCAEGAPDPARHGGQ